MRRVDGKVALVTGAASGIGRGCALALAREGASVIVADVDTDGAAETCRIIEAGGGIAAAQYLDVTDEAGWASAVDGLRAVVPSYSSAMPTRTLARRVPSPSASATHSRACPTIVMRARGVSAYSSSAPH